MTVTEAATRYAEIYQDAYLAFYDVHSQRAELGPRAADKGADCCAAWFAGRVMHARLSDDDLRALLTSADDSPPPDAGS